MGGYHFSTFLNIFQTTKAMQLRFLPNDLAKNSAQNPSIFKFLEPPVMISKKSKTPKTFCLSGGRLVKANLFFITCLLFCFVVCFVNKQYSNHSSRSFLYSSFRWCSFYRLVPDIAIIFRF